jgi:hypothetical protein
MNTCEEQILYNYYDEEECKYHKVSKKKLMYLHCFDYLIHICQYILIVLFSAFILMIFIYISSHILAVI